MSSTDLPIAEQVEPPPPATVLVRYGQLRLVGEFAYDGSARLSCGAKVVIRTRRGTELAKALGCAGEGGCCAVSVPHERIDAYLANSGGKDYPYSTEGRVLRVATPEDLEEQRRLNQQKPMYLEACRTLVREMELPMDLVDVELLLGGEMATFFFLSEHRVDFRALVKQLAARFHLRIQMHQVGARDEARLVADYETCGQQCCCQRFLKVLRPVNMGSAKMQKATLDPNKISGRCGRLKCCLRYEEATYDELKKRLPRVGTRVRTSEGVGVVEETMILTQLVKVRLENDRILALNNEELLDRDVPAGPALPMPRPKPREAPRQEPAEEPAPPAPASRPAGNNGARRSRLRGGRGTPANPSSPTPNAGGNGQEPKPLQPPQAEPMPPADPPSSPEAPRPEGINQLGRRRRRGRGRGRDDGKAAP